MNQDLDARLGRLLLADAPPQRDVFFRIALLERRERQRHRRRSLLLLAGTVLAVLAGALLALVSNPFATALVAAFLLSLLAAGLVSARGVLQAVRWLRGS